MTLDEFWHVFNTTPYPSDWRYGQALFNFLVEVRPDLSEQIRGSGLDTFYIREQDDPRMVPFTQWLSENW